MQVRWDFNLGTIFAIGLPLAGAVIWVNTEIVDMRRRVEYSESFRAARTTQTDKNFVDVVASVRAMQDTLNKYVSDQNNLTYRLGQMEATVTKNNEAINLRMDRLSESLLGSVQTLSGRVSELTTKIELNNQKIDMLDVPRNATRKPAG